MLVLGQSREDAQKKVGKAREIAAVTNPLEEDSLCNSISQIKNEMYSRELEQEFFRRLRIRVRLANRSKYISLVACLEELDIYAKINELAECKKAWASSSASLEALYLTLATPLLEIHAEDLLNFGRLSTYQIKKISDLTGVSMSDASSETYKVIFRIGPGRSCISMAGPCLHHLSLCGRGARADGLEKAS